MSAPGIPSKPVTLHLLSLSTSTPDIRSSLSTLDPPPLVIAKVAKWIHAPERPSTEALTSQGFDILLILPGTSEFPAQIADQFVSRWTTRARVPTEVLNGFATTNRKMLHPERSSIPPIPAENVHQTTVVNDVSLAVTPALEAWAQTFAASPDGAKPVTMLNLLAYEDQEKYMAYVRAFGEGVGTRYGGAAKMVGEVVVAGGEGRGCGSGSGWDDIALVQYPSLGHFMAMIKSEGYKEVDRKWKTGALNDTGLLCVVELDSRG